MHKIVLILWVLVFFLPSLWAYSADDVLGVYRLPNGIDVEIYRGGTGYEGKIVALYNYQNGEENDIKNPDKELRKTPLLGQVIIKDLIFDSKKGIWSDGTMYGPDRGITVHLKVKEIKDNGVVIQGSKLIMKKTMFWERLDS